ncbi:S8 family peptidase [Trinickia fusca]|uniref:Peptidase n=1 Tax=Trinickia fusca TaxID=2419777 RepID=A0A494XEW0_9BURK|nr:S8 family peptidase [Trinickia fusca]RKP49295.1 peptidase [Trinickia fusca]
MKDVGRVATVARFAAVLMSLLPAAETARAIEAEEQDEKVEQLIVKLREPHMTRVATATATASASASAPDRLAGQTAEALLEHIVAQAWQPSSRVEADARPRVRRAAQVTRFTRAMSGDAHVVGLAKPLTADEARALAGRIQAQPEVEYAEPDYRVERQIEPTDPRYGVQWGLQGGGPRGNWPPGGARLPAAWDITTGSTNIVTAVIDTGYRPHVDLAANVLPGYDFISDRERANDGDGRDADAADPGDWTTEAETLACYGSSQFRASSWHGTHVMGTIGALASNGRGGAGVNWHGKLLPVRVLGKCGGQSSDIADAIRWAAGLAVPGAPVNQHPARVINMSLGSQGSCDRTKQSAIDDAIARGAIVVASAGNSNREVGQPANCAGVIAVSAVDMNGNRAWFSNYGARADIGAPGVDILSTVDEGATVPTRDGYERYNGTSMAAPHVAGVASLMLAVDPTLTPEQLRTTLLASTRPYAEGSTCAPNADGTVCGAGTLDAERALEAVRADAANKRGAGAS